MAMYSISGIVFVFRNTDFLQKEISIEKKIETNLSPENLGEAIKIKRLKVEKQEAGIYYFKDGTYNSQTGIAKYTKKELPYVMDRMTHLHKANTNDPLYFLNIFFGFSLLFFVISSYWMFMPGSDVFKKGLYFTLAGIVLTLILLFV
jgi:hypothetical protein